MSAIVIRSNPNLLHFISKRQGHWKWNMSVLCISPYCPHLRSPGPRWPSRNLICNPPLRYRCAPSVEPVLLHVADLRVQPDPIWEPVSNLIMFPLERTVSLDQIRSYSATSGIWWNGSAAPPTAPEDRKINVILHSDIQRNVFRKQICLACVPRLFNIKE